MESLEVIVINPTTICKLLQTSRIWLHLSILRAVALYTVHKLGDHRQYFVKVFGNFNNKHTKLVVYKTSAILRLFLNLKLPVAGKHIAGLSFIIIPD